MAPASAASEAAPRAAAPAASWAVSALRRRADDTALPALLGSCARPSFTWCLYKSASDLAFCAPPWPQGRLAGDAAARADALGADAPAAAPAPPAAALSSAGRSNLG